MRPDKIEDSSLIALLKVRQIVHHNDAALRLMTQQRASSQNGKTRLLLPLEEREIFS